MAVDSAHELPVATLARRLEPATLARRMVAEFSTAIPAYARLRDLLAKRAFDVLIFLSLE